MDEKQEKWLKNASDSANFTGLLLPLTLCAALAAAIFAYRAHERTGEILKLLESWPVASAPARK